MKKSTDNNKKATPQQTDKTNKPGSQPKKPQDPDSIELPDVEDIPGQEHIRPPKLREFNDVTISSAGEEGTGIFDDELTDDNSNVSPEERELLDEAGDYDPDDEVLRRGRLDDVDDEGDPLNESDDAGGEDLDVPGSEDDDADEETGSGDEANNQWSVNKENEEEDPNANSNI